MAKITKAKNLPPQEGNIKLHKESESKIEKRGNFVFGFIGHNRTGKTSRAIQIAEKWRENNPNGKIVTFDPQTKFSHISDDFVYSGMDKDEVYTRLVNELREEVSSLVILDDYKILHKKERSTETWLEDLLFFRSEYNIDIIYIIHNPALVVEIFTYFTTHYFVFYTESKIGTWEKKIPNYTLCQTASLYINEYVREHGRGEYPNFPHIIVETETERLIAQNMRL